MINKYKKIKPKHCIYAMALLFIIFRLLYLHADPSGPYLNTDEGHQNNDARSILLYGTPFYDSYNPSLLMPLFTIFKTVFLAAFGINLFAIRIPSVFCSILAVLVFCEILKRRNETLSALLLMFYAGVSYYYFSHARMGTHEAMVMFFSAITLAFLYYAFETRRAIYYLLSFLSMLCVPMIKTSGVFIFGTVGFCILYKAIFDRDSLNSRAILYSTLVCMIIVTMVTALWLYPHFAEVSEFYVREVIAKKSVNLFGSAKSTLQLIYSVDPFLLIMGVLGFIGFVFNLLKNHKETNSLEIILFSWLIGGAIPLLYSFYQPPRYLMWLILPLTIIATREFVKMVNLSHIYVFRRHYVPNALLVGFFLFVIISNFKYYYDYYKTIDFYIYNTSKEVEKIAGNQVVSGSGFSDFASNSSIINHVSCFHRCGFESCEEIKRAFPEESKVPKFLAIHIGGDENKFDGIIRRFYSQCFEWKKAYRVFKRFRRINPPGTYDQWFIRTE
jgi:4-amino-4-deoxy-L-arabinose transferase-like glycosyltransferase